MVAGAVGTVVVWHDERGWGLVALADSGDEVWAHFSSVEGRASGTLEVGEEVVVWDQPGSRPGTRQAVRVVPTTNVDPRAGRPQPPSEAYRSSLTIIDDPD